MELRAVILAAGISKRTGSQKLLLPFRGRPMVDYAVDAARQWNPVVVAGAQVAEYVAARAGVEVIVNDAPQRGMTHSLALANDAVAQKAALIVLLGDKPLVTPPLIARLCETMGNADVLFPMHPQTREPGHPVLFSPRARSKIAHLPDGDTLSLLRDDPQLVRREVACEDRGAYFDVDTAAVLE
jgi:molybdenum cofactor cytidylyltransferase